MKTKVIITIDTEFSIGGAFSDPARFSPVGEQAVLCQIKGKSHGLGFLIETFDEFNISATFFVETFNTYYFGDQPMRDLACRIRSAGHDLQLHLHPCWTYFKNRDWVQHLKVDPPTDHMNGRSLAQLTEWIKEGIEIFARWGLDRPIALRTGSLITDKTVYEAMEACKMTVGSNIAVGIFRPEDPTLQLYSGLHHVGNVLEACVLTYLDPRRGRPARHRALSITGTSWPEIRSLLSCAHKSNIESVVILTHPFEFVKRGDDPSYSKIYQNRINQNRLKKLCAFLAANHDKYEVVTMKQLASSAEKMDDDCNILLKSPWSKATGRMLENALNDRIKFL